MPGHAIAYGVMIFEVPEKFIAERKIQHVITSTKTYREAATSAHTVKH
jgi:hypothetical protein